LALATAGAFLKETSLSCSDYLQQYETKWEVVPNDEELPDYPTRTLYTTWNLSLSQIKQQNPQAAKLLAFLAYFDHQDIWYELLRTGQGADRPAWFTELISDKFSFESAMRTLTRYCLVESHHQTESYSLHVCVHDWNLDGLNHDIDSNQYWLAFDCVAGHVLLDGWDDLSVLRYRRLTPHAVRLAHERFQPAGCQQEWLHTELTRADLISQLLHQQIQYKAAERMYLRALVGYEKALGLDHTSTLETVHNLGTLYLSQDKLAEAEQMYERALAGLEKALGPDHTSTLETVHNLGLLYCSQGKLDKAERMYGRALAGLEKALGPDHMSTLETVHNLGLLYCSQGKLDKAERMYGRALAGYGKALGFDHTSTLITMISMGTLLCLQGQLSEAENMYQYALSGTKRALGPDHIRVLGTVNNLAKLYCEQGKLFKAREMYEQALGGITRSLGPDHSFISGMINNRGLLYAEKGELDAAQQMYQQARDGFQRSLGSRHPYTQMVCYNIEQLGLIGARAGVLIISNAEQKNSVDRPRRRWYY
jgi:tetratricopeptide (TPR) repeat protein